MPMFFGSVLVSQVACLVLALLVSTSDQADCSGITQCRGHRPLLPNGCCPIEAGEECRPDEGYLCDTDLGFSCVNDNDREATNKTGECKGLYNLRVTDREETSLTVEWTAFAPTDYQFEYNLFLRTDSYHYDLGKWESRACGDKPRYEIYDLKPSTLYLIKVATFQDARTLGNISETIMVQTEDAEYCDVEEIGERISVGKSFVIEGEDNCTCLPNAELECTLLCPETGMPDVPAGCRLDFDENSCDYTVVCPLAGESCKVDNETHPHGAEVQQGCQICVCNNGEFGCYYPYYCPTTPPESCLRPKLVNVDGLCCPEWQCDEVCVYENKTYTDGDFFTSSQCGLCQCNVTEGVQCESDCPPVEMVLPDAACPDPHIRQTGCCDTLHCFDPNMDTLTLVQNVFATAFTMTLSFEVETILSEEQGAPVFCQYEIFYANASASPVRWHNQIVQPVDVRILADSSTIRKPREALTKEAAIVVGTRVYVTMSGMHPDTTYYVNVRKIAPVNDDMATTDGIDGNLLINGHSAMIVVKTRPLKNITSCFHSGREVLHGVQVPSNCSQICHCLYGQIHCQSACPDQKQVVVPTKSCPDPRLEEKEEECCPQWQCYPTESGCFYNKAILASGQIVNDGCQECICLNSTIQCTSLCPSDSQPLRPGCVLQNVSDHCCPQWLCPREVQPPIGVKGSILIVFLGGCPQPVANFKTDLMSHFYDYIGRLVDCSEDSIEIYHICNTLNIEVDCFDQPTSNVKRKKKSLPSFKDRKITGLALTVQGNLSLSDDLSIIRDIDSTILTLQTLLNTTFDLHLTDGTVLQSTKGIYVQNTRYACNPRFSYINGKCVLSEVEVNDSPKAQVDIAIVNVTSKSVLIQWKPLPTSLQAQLKSLVIRFKASENHLWSSTQTFEHWVTSCVLFNLHPNTNYTVKLVASTGSDINNKWTLGDVSFQTLTYSGVIPKSLNVHEIFTSKKSIVIAWDPLSPELLEHVKSISVTYGESMSDKIKMEITAQGASLARLTDLSPGTDYLVDIKVLIDTGVTISKTVEVTTESDLITHPRSDKGLLIPFVIICVVAAAIGFVCVVLYWRRSSSKESNRGFENKTYGMQLENTTDICPSISPSSN